MKERGLRPLSKTLPLGYSHCGAFNRGASPSFFSSPSPNKLIRDELQSYSLERGIKGVRFKMG